MKNVHATTIDEGQKPPPVLLNSRTHDHLRAAFAAEGQAYQLLTSFAQIAEIEGFVDIAALLRQQAEAHALHAHGHLDLLRRAVEPLTGMPMGLSARNLPCATAVQRQLADQTYPDMIRTAVAEGFLDIADWLKTVARASEEHGDQLAQLAERPNQPPDEGQP